MNPALYDALNCLSAAVLCAGTDRHDAAEAAFMEASLAAEEAFPEGSPGAASLSVLLDEVREGMQAVAA